MGPPFRRPPMTKSPGWGVCLEFLAFEWGETRPGIERVGDTGEVETGACGDEG